MYPIEPKTLIATCKKKQESYCSAARAMIQPWPNSPTLHSAPQNVYKDIAIIWSMLESNSADWKNRCSWYHVSHGHTSLNTARGQVEILWYSSLPSRWHTGLSTSSLSAFALLSCFCMILQIETSISKANKRLKKIAYSSVLQSTAKATPFRSPWTLAFANLHF